MTLPMTTIDYERVRATRAPLWMRQLIRIPEDSTSCHHSSLTDYLDRTVCYSPEGMRQIDSLIEKYRLGAVNKTMNDHYGTVLPRINRKDQILGGSVIYFDAEKGDMLKSEPLTDNLYQWYCFDYYTDDSVFFGEHTLSGKPVAVAQEEKTVLLGALAMPEIDWLAIGHGNDLSEEMARKLFGRQAILFADDMNCDYYDDRFGKFIKIDKSFVDKDINFYLASQVSRQYS